MTLLITITWTEESAKHKKHANEAAKHNNDAK